MRLNVTHFFRRAPENDWVPLPFITRRPNDPKASYYFGSETIREIPPKIIGRQLKNNTLKALSWPAAILPGQTVWLTPDNEIYLASENDPVGDQSKLMIDLACNPPILQDTWKTGSAFKQLMTSNVTRMVSERGEFNYVFGDYLASVRSPGNGTVYSPEWQKRVLSFAKEDLEKATARHLKLERLQEQEHRYRHIEELIVKENLPIHWEMIFKTRRREMTVDVIHLANVHKLSLVCIYNSSVHKKLQLEDQKPFTRHFEEWVRCLDETRTEVCAPTDQASEHLLLHAITKKKLNRELKTERSTLRELKDWLLEEPHKNQRVVVCDVGIAKRLKADCANQTKLVSPFVQYDAPIPVGIAHKKEDAVWRNFLMREIKRASNSNMATIRSSIDDTKTRCEELGMNWVWQN